MQQLHDDVLDLVGHGDSVSHRVRKDDLTLSDQLAQLVVVLVHKWRSASDHLVDEHSKGPPVDGERVACLVEDLWRQILSCATEALRLLVLLEEFGQAEVCKLDIASFSDKHVFRFEVAMHDAVGMQVAHSDEYLSGNELDLGL